MHYKLYIILYWNISSISFHCRVKSRYLLCSFDLNLTLCLAFCRTVRLMPSQRSLLTGATHKPSTPPSSSHWHCPSCAVQSPLENPPYPVVLPCGLGPALGSLSSSTEWALPSTLQPLGRQMQGQCGWLPPADHLHRAQDQLCAAFLLCLLSCVNAAFSAQGWASVLTCGPCWKLWHRRQ